MLMLYSTKWQGFSQTSATWVSVDKITCLWQPIAEVYAPPPFTVLILGKYNNKGLLMLTHVKMSALLIIGI